MKALPAKDAYRLLAAEYDRTPNALLSLEQRTLVPLLPQLSAKLVVDVAAGTGRWASYCAARQARAVAVDFCREMLDQACVSPIQADASQLPFSDSCADLVVCAFGLGYTPGSLPELARITRPGGIVLVSDIHPHALERGWTRSFRHNGNVIGVAHHRYSLRDLHAPGLALTALEEPTLGPPEREIYECAGRLDLFEEARDWPAVFVAQWIKS